MLALVRNAQPVECRLVNVDLLTADLRQNLRKIGQKVIVSRSFVVLEDMLGDLVLQLAIILEKSGWNEVKKAVFVQIDLAKDERTVKCL